MKNSRFLKSIFTLGFVTFMSSCSMMYMPNTINTPLLGEKGDLEVSAYTALNGYDIQTAYAATDNIGVMINTNFADNSSDTTINAHKHFFLEGGVGYFKKIGENTRAEIYGGFGMGTIDQEYDAGSVFFGVNEIVKNNRIFIQPGIGTSTDFFDFSFAPRISYLNASQGSTKVSGLFIEPAVTLKAGFKYLKFVSQIGYAFSLANKYNFAYQPFLVSFGIQANIGEFLK